MKNFLLLLFFSCAFTLQAQKNAFLQSGPMLGYSEMREVLLWVQTTESAKVQVKYWATKSILKDSFAIPITRDTFWTSPVVTEKSHAYAAKLLADEVEPGYHYDYELWINDKVQSFSYPLTFQSQTLWLWRTSPPDFRVALGSCVYVNEPKYDRPGKGYGGGYEIFETMHKMKPDLMMWLGDNVYFREVDWLSKTGMQKRYTHTRSLKEMQPFLASTHHYAIWDDHDYGPNDSDRSFIHKDKALEVFQDFWGNPSFGLPHAEGGIATQFLWNDVHFFMIDNRYFRTPNKCETCEKVYFGKEQIDWLIEALVNSKASFKLIAAGGQILNTAEVYENYINLNETERAYLLQRLEEEDIHNVVFLTGDRHHTELSRYKNAKGNTVIDWTVSPLTSGSGMHEEVNKLRVKDTMVGEKNFGILDFTGGLNERTMTMTVYNTNGKKLWQEIVVKEKKEKKTKKK